MRKTRHDSSHESNSDGGERRAKTKPKHPQWLLKEMGRRTSSSSSSKHRSRANDRADRARAFLERRKKKMEKRADRKSGQLRRREAADTDKKNSLLSSQVIKPNTNTKMTSPSFKNGDHVCVIFGKRKDERAVVLRNARGEGRWYLRMSTDGEVINYPETKFRRVSTNEYRKRGSASSVLSSTASLAHSRRKSTEMSAATRRARNASVERRRRASAEKRVSIPSDPIRRPFSEQLHSRNTTSKVDSVEAVRKHLSHPPRRRLRRRRLNRRPPVPGWVLREMGRKDDSAVGAAVVVDAAARRSSNRRRSDHSMGQQRRRTLNVGDDDDDKKNRRGPPTTTHPSPPVRPRAGARVSGSLKDMIWANDHIAFDAKDEEDGEMEGCWHTLVELATSERRHADFMLMLLELYSKPLSAVHRTLEMYTGDAHNHADIATDRLQSLVRLVDNGWETSSASALFRGLSNVVAMSREMATVFEPILQCTDPQHRSRIVRQVCRAFVKLAETRPPFEGGNVDTDTTDDDVPFMPALAAAYMDFCANSPFASRKLSQMLSRVGIGNALRLFLRRQQRAQASFLISRGSHTQRDMVTLNHITLDAVMIKPVQRLAKYPLLLRETLKGLPETHSARWALERARDAASGCASIVDDVVADTEEVAALWSVYERLSIGGDVSNGEPGSATDESVGQVVSALPRHVSAQRERLANVLRRLVSPHRRFVRECSVLVAFDCYACQRYHDSHSRECVVCSASFCVSCKKSNMIKIATKTWVCVRCRVREQMNAGTNLSTHDVLVTSSPSPDCGNARKSRALKRGNSLRALMHAIAKSPGTTKGGTEVRSPRRLNSADEEEEDGLIPSPTASFRSMGDLLNINTPSTKHEDRRASSSEAGGENLGLPEQPDDSVGARKRILVFSDLLLFANEQQQSSSLMRLLGMGSTPIKYGEGDRLELDVHTPPIWLGSERARARLPSIRDSRSESNLPSRAFRVIPASDAWGRGRKRATSSVLKEASLHADFVANRGRQNSQSHGQSFVVWCRSEDEKDALWATIQRLITANKERVGSC